MLSPPLKTRTRVIALGVVALLLASCATSGPLQLVPGPPAAELLVGTWVGDASGHGGIPFWFFFQEVIGAEVRGEEWGFQDVNRWEPFRGTISRGELRIELRQIKQTMLLRPFDVSDGVVELRGRMAGSPPDESPIRLIRQH